MAKDLGLNFLELEQIEFERSRARFRLNRDLWGCLGSALAREMFDGR